VEINDKNIVVKSATIKEKPVRQARPIIDNAFRSAHTQADATRRQEN
jgi:hypothetical protein